MKKPLSSACMVLCLLVFACASLWEAPLHAQATAQNGGYPRTISMKMQKKVNGVSTAVDTTFTVDNDAEMNAAMEKMGFGPMPDLQGIDMSGGGVIATGSTTTKLTSAPDSTGALAPAVQAVVDSALANGGQRIATRTQLRVSMSGLTAEDETLVKSFGPEAAGFDLMVANRRFKPNAAAGTFALSFDLASEGDMRVRVFTADGKTVWDEAIKKFTGSYAHTLALPELKGVYFLHIQQNKQTYTDKITVK